MKIINRAVVVGSLGCFVDSYDLVLFSMLRIPSLKSIGVPENMIINVGITLLNLQMIGLLTGGILWGILGDKRGRVSVLFGSIFIYSVANLGNAFVSSIWAYGFFRVLAGIGLAGELGAAVTLISEQMSKKDRGYGTMLVAFLGAVGGLSAALVTEYFPWRTAYIVGGILGFILLGLRMGMSESPLFQAIKSNNVERGNFLRLFASPKRFLKYLSCICIALPIWFVVGILISFSPEICKALGYEGVITVSKALVFTQIGAFMGDLSSGSLSQIFKNRRKVLVVFLLLSFICCFVYISFMHCLSTTWADAVFFMLGYSNGYWAVYITTIAESFGTDLRATVTTSVPNFVRGSAVLLTLGLKFFRSYFGLVNAVIVVGVTSFLLAFLSFSALKESYGKDLDYTEIGNE